MLNVLSAPVWDFDGFVQLQVLPDNTAGETRRRVNRLTTLDGGVVVNDFGFSEGDRTITLVWSPATREIESAVDRLIKTYSVLHVSTRAGVFLAAPETYTPGSDRSTLRLLVLAKLSL